jgi:hypothetical protein
MGDPSEKLRSVPELPQGYTMAEVDRLASVAAGTVLTHVGQSMAERIDDAWSAIVERLYADPEPIEPGQLVWVAKKALYRGDRTYERHHGVFKRDRMNGFGSMPRFQQFWYQPVATFEDSVVDVRAFAEIWPQLSPGEQEAVVAVAVWGDQTAASEALGKEVKYNLYHARKRFLALWHEHETPSKHWGYDHPGPFTHGRRELPEGRFG